MKEWSRFFLACQKPLEKNLMQNVGHKIEALGINYSVRVFKEMESRSIQLFIQTYTMRFPQGYRAFTDLIDR